MRIGRRFGWAAAVAAAIASFHLVWLAAGFGGASVVGIVSDLVQIPAPLLATVACAWRARREGPGGARLAWILLAASQAKRWRTRWATSQS